MNVRYNEPVPFHEKEYEFKKRNRPDLELTQGFLNDMQKLKNLGNDLTKNVFFRIQNESYKKYLSNYKFTDTELMLWSSIKRSESSYPYEENRVNLKNLTDWQDLPEQGNLINGSLIKLGRDTNYIITESPLPNMIPDFYRMIWQYGIKIVVCLCDYPVDENGEKLNIYWPTDYQQIGFFNGALRLRLDSVTEYIGGVLRRFIIGNYFKNKNQIFKEERYLYHIQIVNIEKLCLEKPMIVETLLLAVYQELKENCYHKVKPYLLIHDNIGGLRAGLFVALCFYANACNYNQINHYFDVFDIVNRIEMQRYKTFNSVQYFQALLNIAERFGTSQLKLAESKDKSI